MKAIIVKTWAGGNNQYCNFAILLITDFLVEKCQKWQEAYKKIPQLKNVVKVQEENCGPDYVKVYFIESLIHAEDADIRIKTKLNMFLSNIYFGIEGKEVMQTAPIDFSIEDLENASIKTSEKIYFQQDGIKIQAYSGMSFIETPKIPHNLIFNVWHTKHLRKER